MKTFLHKSQVGKSSRLDDRCAAQVLERSIRRTRDYHCRSHPLVGICLAALLAGWAIAATSQSTFKCLDSRGRVTYSNIACATQGLKDAGPVADRTMTVPMGAPKKPPPKAESKPSPKDDPEIGPMPSPVQIKPINPLIEKLLK